MLVYAYPHLERANFGRFSRPSPLGRRCSLCAVDAFLLLLGEPSRRLRYVPADRRISESAFSPAWHTWGTFYVSGYYQLLTRSPAPGLPRLPIVPMAVAHGARQPWSLIAISAAVQLGMACLLHWNLVPGWLSGFSARQEVWNYPLYMIAGGLMALYYREVHGWLCHHWRLVLSASVVTLVISRGMVLARRPQGRTYAWRDQPGRPLSARRHTAIYVPHRRYLPPRCRRSPSAGSSVNQLRYSVRDRQFLWHLPEPGTLPRHFSLLGYGRTWRAHYHGRS